MAENVVNVKFGAEIAGFIGGVDRVRGKLQELTASVREPIEALGRLSSILSKPFELIGLGLAAERIREFAVEMAQAAQDAVNLSFALGISTAELAELRGVFILSSASADDAGRTFRRLALSVQQALVDSNSQAAVSFQNLGIRLDEVKAKGGNLIEFFKLLIQRYSELERNQRNQAALQEVAGRGVESLIPVLAQGAAGYRELAEESRDYQRSLTEFIPAGLRVDNAIDRLTLHFKTLANDGFRVLEGPLTRVIELLDFVVRLLDYAAIGIQKVIDFENKLEGITKHAFNDLARLFGLGKDFFGAEGPPPEPPHGTRKLGTLKAGPPAAGGNSAADDAARQALEDEAQLERELNEETQIRIGNIEAERRAADIGFESQIAHLRSLAQQGNLTAAEALKQEQQLNFDRWESDENYLQQKDNLFGPQEEAAHQRILDQELVQTAAFNSRLTELNDEAAENTGKSWKTALKQVGDAFGDFASDVLLRVKSIGEAFADLVRSLLSDAAKSAFKSLFESALGLGSGTGGGGFLSGAFNSLGGAIFGKGLAGLFGGGGAGGILSGAGESAAITGAGAAATGGGFFSFLGSLLPAIPFLDAGAWSVPHDMTARIHKGEAVVPVSFAQGMRSANGGIAPAGGAAALTVHFHTNAVDGASVAAFFRTHGPTIADTLNTAWRHGSPFRPPG